LLKGFQEIPTPPGKGPADPEEKGQGTDDGSTALIEAKIDPTKARLEDG